MSDIPNLFPALDSATEAALRESIKRFGVLVPVVRDQHGRTLDGHHRSRLADDLGVDYRVDVVPVEDDEQAREIAATLNTDRRQMTPEQRRDIVAALRQNGHSLRAIAGAVGVSHPTVIDDLKQAGGKSLPPVEVTGQDGKRYPATRPEPPRAAEPDASEPLSLVDQPDAPTDLADTDIGRLAAEDLTVRQTFAVKQFVAAISATYELRPMLDHVVQSVLALDGDTRAEDARNCLQTWALIAEALDQSRTIRRVK